MAQMINRVFLQIVEMSLTAGIVILVVLLVRLLIKRLPKSFAYALWIVVAFRLVVPTAADSGISIFNLFTVGSTEDKSSEITGDKGIAIEMVKDSPNITDKNVADAINVEPNTETAGKTAGSTFILREVPDSARNISFVSKMALIWIAGIMTLVSYTVIAHIRIRRRIRYSIRLRDNVYECDNIRSPFVIGIVSPKIYLPFRLQETEQQCILAHEWCHIRRRDDLVKSFAYLLAVVYWFHPLVWAAYRLMCIDMEMSCDEKVISGFTVDMRKEYSRLLLAFAANKRQFPASPLAFGEESTMKRIKNILHYRKAAQWKLIVGAAVLVLTMAACATDASVEGAIAPVPETTFVTRNGTENVTDVSENDIVVELYHTVEHHQAQWAENSKFDLEFYSLDYADSDRIVFHISSGLFAYDLKSQRLTRSIDLKALRCQEVQTGGECEVAVYQNSDRQLRAVIRPYPYSDADSYVYDMESDELYTYDPALLDDYVLFEGFASKYDPAVSEAMRTWRAAANVLPLGENSYGALYWGPGPDLVNLSYEAGDQKWTVFHKDQATLPRLMKQDDNFYQSFSLHSGKEIAQCTMDYKGFYNLHDYAGVCALSTGLEYSDEMQRAFSERSDELLHFREVSHSEDEKEYLFELEYAEDSGEKEQKVYLNFIYIEGEGWRAKGLPAIQGD